MLRAKWWKLLSFVLLLYTCTYGFLVEVPKLDDRMQESIRNFFFHVPMWFGMMILFFVSLWYAIKYLRNGNIINDIYASAYASIGLLFGVLGIITGAVWANYQWGSPWVGDPKQNGAAIALLIYFAYFVLRGSLIDQEKKARLSAVYNVFAFFLCYSQHYGFCQDYLNHCIQVDKVVRAIQALMEKTCQLACVQFFIQQ